MKKTARERFEAEYTDRDMTSRRQGTDIVDTYRPTIASIRVGMHIRCWENFDEAVKHIPGITLIDTTKHRIKTEGSGYWWKLDETFGERVEAIDGDRVLVRSYIRGAWEHTRWFDINDVQVVWGSV